MRLALSPRPVIGKKPPDTQRGAALSEDAGCPHSYSQDIAGDLGLPPRPASAPVSEAHRRAHTRARAHARTAHGHTRAHTHAGLSLALGDATPRSEVAAHAGAWRPGESPQGHGTQVGAPPTQDQGDELPPRAGAEARRPSEARSWRTALPGAARRTCGADGVVLLHTLPSCRSAFSSSRPGHAAWEGGGLVLMQGARFWSQPQAGQSPAP